MDPSRRHRLPPFSPPPIFPYYYTLIKPEGVSSSPLLLPPVDLSFFFFFIFIFILYRLQIKSPFLLGFAGWWTALASGPKGEFPRFPNSDKYKRVIGLFVVSKPLCASSRLSVFLSKEFVLALKIFMSMVPGTT